MTTVWYWLFFLQVQVFKITQGMVELPPECHPVSRHQPAARGHSQQLQRLQPSVDAYKYAFFPRTIPAWNALPVELVEAESLEAFKLCLYSHSSNITTSCVYTKWTVFLHLFLFEFTYALLPHCTFWHRCSLWLPCGATSFGGHCHLLNQNQNVMPINCRIAVFSESG